MTPPDVSDGGSQRPAELEEIDFGGEIDAMKPVHGPVVFDPEPGRERVRALVAGALIALLAVLTCAAVAAVFVGTSTQDMRSIIELVLPPAVALCGSAIGFYFGSNRPGGR